MPNPHSRQQRLPKLDRQRQKDDVRLLFFTGNHSLREAARLVGVAEDTACKWAAQGKWTAELQRIKALAQGTQSARSILDGEAKGSTAAAVAFDLAQTNKQSRAALAQVHNLAIMETLRQLTEKPGKIVVETPQDLKALTESTAKVDGTWDDASANKFAVSLNLNAIVQGGGVTEIAPGAIVEIEE